MVEISGLYYVGSLFTSFRNSNGEEEHKSYVYSLDLKAT